jgi:hypothetical protein
MESPSFLDEPNDSDPTPARSVMSAEFIETEGKFWYSTLSENFVELFRNVKQQ